MSKALRLVLFGLETVTASAEAESQPASPLGGSTTADAIGGLGAATAGVNAVTIPDVTQTTGGNSFSFANSYTQGDTVPTAAPTVGAVPAFGDITSESAGSAGTLAGTINTSGAITLSPGTGTGISAIGQVITELTTR